MSTLIRKDRIRQDLASTESGKGVDLVGGAAKSANLSSSAAGKGGALVGFDWTQLAQSISKVDWGIQTAATGVNVLRYIPPSEWAAIMNGTSTYDCTAEIQSAINAHSRVYMPPGVYIADPVVGLVVRTGTNLVGAGKNKTIIVAKAGGGTLTQLVNYNRGSLIRRQFNKSPGTNAYVNEVYLADFSVVLTHPTGSVTTTEIQIGIDLRNITRSIVKRVHVGNIAPIGGAYSKPKNGAYDVQGYGIVVGNVSSGESSYAGGEVNTIRDCSVWGAYKLIVQDDGTLSPLSSAHATTVQNCDLQAGHHVLVQESQYATGNAWRDNTLQFAIKQPGDASNAFIARCEGYNCEMSGGYIEAGPYADYLLYLGGNSKNNHFRLSYYSATNSAAITDAGSKNEVEYFENAGTVPGGLDPFGAPVRLYDRAFKSAWVKFHWNGSSVVIDGGQGVQSVTRIGIGDYMITWAKVFSSDDYSVSVSLDTNASGHGGTFSIGSHSSSNLRIYTYAQNGGTSSIIDPRNVWVKVAQ